ncbi:Poly(ADP-ribose) glycohydrolase [Trypanosoma melophagium]|uniref:Poly(ADP-ribose) glycohydrolase n=1 Tax=Trypanosoma melophagium TaxID=715481 RepID=UPI00351A7410|nr:Poly(ADP-ribose) glycohydrolase [Trypanosoma melophagium]
MSKENMSSCGGKLRQSTLDAFMHPKPDNNTTLDSLNTDSERINKDSNSVPNRNTIILPWSQENRCMKKETGEVCQAWDIITTVMREKDVYTTYSLRRLLQALLVRDSNNLVSSKWKFDILCYVIDDMMLPREREDFFDATLPWMKQIVINGPLLIPTNQLPILSQGETKRLLFTYEEVTTLMACGFFSLFPGRFPYCGKGREKSKKLGPFNFVQLFSLAPNERIESQRAKVRCLLQYFIDCSHNMDSVKTGLELYRVGFSSFPNFHCSTALMQNVITRADGFIEESYGNLQVDFANKFIGGGVLRSGCVQEEIRFVTCPELILSILVCDSLQDNEVLFMSGAGEYSITRGYANSFRFLYGNSPRYVTLTRNAILPGHHQMMVELVPTTRQEGTNKSWIVLRNTCVVAMDAVNYRGCAEKQYTYEFIVRELRKAFVAFKGVTDSTLTSVHTGPVATGNWGCGAFQGELQLKLMIQWCAASQAGRSLIYYAFWDDAFCCRFQLVYEKIKREAWTVGNVLVVLLLFGQSCEQRPCLLNGGLFDYILSTPRWRCPSLQ